MKFLMKDSQRPKQPIKKKMHFWKLPQFKLHPLHPVLFKKNFNVNCVRHKNVILKIVKNNKNKYFLDFSPIVSSFFIH